MSIAKRNRKARAAARAQRQVAVLARAIERSQRQVAPMLPLMSAAHRMVAGENVSIADWALAAAIAVTGGKIEKGLRMIELALLAPPLDGNGALISSCGMWRYTLWRTWDPQKPRVVWIMCNPSTADAYADDPTIRKCCGFSRRWDAGGIVVINVCALRSPDPKALMVVAGHVPGFAVPGHLDAVGPMNRAVIRTVLSSAPGRRAVVAWGDALPRSLGVVAQELVIEQARELGVTLMCLGRTQKRREPRHPLMLGYDTTLEEFAYEPSTTPPSACRTLGAGDRS